MNGARLRFDLSMRLWSLGSVVNRLGTWPLLEQLMRPCFSSESNEAIIIPVQEAVRGTESVILPFSLLTPLIGQASTRVLLDNCLCRQGEGCSKYPADLGCLFLGDAAAQIDRTLGHPVNLEQAMDHAQTAMNLGLVPMIVHSSFDAWLLNIPYHSMLAVCFCCDCCCSVRQGLRLGPESFWETVVRLPGLSVHISPECTNCSVCVTTCPVGAITMSRGVAAISNRCKGCGHCVDACPVGAIHMHLDENQDVLSRLMERVVRRTDIGLRGKL